MVCCFASKEFQAAVWKFSRGHSIPRFTDWNIKAGSRANGASPKINARPSFTASPEPANANCKKRQRSGIAWLALLRESCEPRPSKCEGGKHDSLAPLSILASRNRLAHPDRRRNGRGTAIPYGGLLGRLGSEGS